MHNDTPKKLPRERILEAIKSGRVRMQPRWHFILRAILAAVGGVMILLALLYVASFVLFYLRETGIWFVPVFGSHGWFEFFASLPWLLILLALVFIVILEILVRRYAFAYRQPLLYSAIAIMLIVVLGGIILERTSFHEQLFRFAEENRLPFAGAFYRNFGNGEPRRVHVGAVVSTTSDGFIIQGRHHETTRVIVAPETNFPPGTQLFTGDTVVVFGDRDDGLIYARGIRKVSGEFGLPPIPRSDDQPLYPAGSE